MNIQEVAQQLLEAERTKAPIAPLTTTYKEISAQQAYQDAAKPRNQVPRNPFHGW